MRITNRGKPALALLSAELYGVGDRRIQQQLYDASKRLASEPEKQGKALREGLPDFRSLRAIGQRHRVIFSVSTETRKIFVVAAGLRREGARDDIYALAQRLIRLGLVPPPAKPRSAAVSGARKAGSPPRKRKRGK